MEPLKRYNLHVEDPDQRIQFIVAERGEWMKADAVIARIDELVEALIKEQRRTWQADVYDAYLNACAARIAELEAERHYLNWFHMAADFGPADYDVVVAMQAEYEKQTGKPVPEGWRYKDDE